MDDPFTSRGSREDHEETYSSIMTLISSVNNFIDDRPFIYCKIDDDNKPIKCLVDTGATVSLITRSCVRDDKTLNSWLARCAAANGDRIHIKGQTTSHWRNYQQNIQKL